MALVDSLLNLYRVEVQVRGLRARLNTAERYLAGQTKFLNDLLGQQQELQTRQRHLQAIIGNTEVEIQGIDQRLEKLRNELNSAVTNKQYSALLGELNTVKTARSSVEERLLADMEQLEKVQQQLAALAVQLTERSKLRDLAQAQLDERRNDVGQRLSELEAERHQAAAVIPVQSLAIFEELADQFDGEAMGPIEEIDRRHREYACGACNMHLPFEQVSMATAHNEALVRCPSCTRILYMQDEMRGSLAKK